MCDDECKTVSRVLWDCPIYTTPKKLLRVKFRDLLGDRFEHFESLDSFEKAVFVLGSELWEDDCVALA